VRTRLALAALLPLLIAAPSGCRRGGDLPRRTGSFAVSRGYESPPATIRLRVDRVSITVAESILVILDAEARDGATAQLPDALPSGSGFTVVDTGTERSASGSTTRLSRWFLLEPFLSGDYALEPFGIEVKDAKGALRTVRTDRVAVKVASLLPKDYNRLDIKDIEGILRSPWRPPPWLWIVLGVLLTAGAGTAAWLLRQRMALSRQAAAARPAHEMAYEELDALLAEDLVSHGEVKLFYQRVTGILRKYIERRFGLRAPERTTEEFLYELRETAVLSEELKKLLRAFLQHCDLVKFAQLRPLGEEIQGTLESCRDFVRATELAAPDPATQTPRGRPRAV
jgi:hypothetical protein